MGHQFERRYVEEDEQDFAEVNEAPVRKSKGADLAKLLAEADDTDLSYTSRCGTPYVLKGFCL